LSQLWIPTEEERDGGVSFYSTIVRLKRGVEDGIEDRMEDRMKDRWLKKKVLTVRRDTALYDKNI
jgi:hypothetical protein